ncbi:hypothetical protein [Cellulomonas sp. ATA003]|uniref:hypothetical protein n=1 Tax=Cellulomonas sp. ATA003 TaxID=3073064 RepID=UPI0028731379|nr:hypothetical protein [Cellulomonas sp. ATA003]WNB87650.1 hypothetical protein REH70_15980 [Cellulomonas sp. ATA003]
MVEPVVVEVWVAPADTAVPAWAPEVLDPAELDRATAMPDHTANGFLLGRLLLRTVLADRLGCAPHDVVLRADCPRCGGRTGG